MSRYAIFVDAGYFLTEGCKSLTGQEGARHNLQLKEQKAVQTLKVIARDHLPNQELLRIYWYDGALGHHLSKEHFAIASLDDVKLRLGIINKFNEQKGVDSLIVTDLVELARLKSISDVFLLSGDEDVRIGVQIAQNYGVRVHLLGIKSDKQSRSEQLIREADTVSLFLTKDQVQKFLRYTPGKKNQIITDSVRSFVDNLTSQEKKKVREHWNAEQRGIPEALDRRLLAHCRDSLERFLEPNEIRYMRACFGTILAETTKS